MWSVSVRTYETWLCNWLYLPVASQSQLLKTSTIEARILSLNTMLIMASAR